VSLKVQFEDLMSNIKVISVSVGLYYTE
jgi:hypothetical protein